MKGVYLGDNSFPLRNLYSFFGFFFESIDGLLRSSFDKKPLAIGFQYLVVDQSRCDKHRQMSFARRHERLNGWSCLFLFLDQTERRLFPEETCLKLFGKLVRTKLRRSDEEV